MAEKIKQSVPWFLVLTLICAVSVAVFNLNKPLSLEVSADVATTTVTVGNAAPAWVAVYESPESSTASPTNAGQTVTFVGRANDPNSENWFLVICASSTAVSTTTGGTCPTCSTGITLATSTAADNATATAVYTTLAGNPEQNNWYAWACDANAVQKCTASTTGTGGSANLYSPFVVNHVPTFTAQANSGPVNPASTTVFFASSTDSDSYGGADTLIFSVCKTTGLTGTWCDGGASDTWCTTTASANPNCSITAPDPGEGAQSYYPYIFDGHGFAVSGGLQGSSQSYTISNVTPVVSSVTLNGGSAINLSTGGEGPSGNVNILATADMVDHNGCSDITTTTVKAYPTAVGSTTCSSQNNNTCYYNVSCTAGPCQGNGYTATTSCTINFKYHADPTDASTPRSAETWKDTITARDETFSGSTELGTGVELNSYLALDVTSAINYGTLSVGDIADGVSLPQLVAASTTGNTGLDVEISGGDMCTDFPGCSGGRIATSSQKYATSSVTYNSAVAYALATAATQLELDCLKTTTTATPQGKPIYWGLQIPGGTIAGSYTGQNTFTAVMAEIANW
jgi:hypothetical protein